MADLLGWFLAFLTVIITIIGFSVVFLISAVYLLFAWLFRESAQYRRKKK